MNRRVEIRSHDEYQMLDHRWKEPDDYDDYGSAPKFLDVVVEDERTITDVVNYVISNELSLQMVVASLVSENWSRCYHELVRMNSLGRYDADPATQFVLEELMRFRLDGYWMRVQDALDEMSLNRMRDSLFSDSQPDEVARELRDIITDL